MYFFSTKEGENMEEKKKTSNDQKKKNKMVKMIVAILAIIIVLLLLRSCAKRESLKIQLSDEWFYSDDIATDVIENIISVNGYTLNHNGEMYISDDSNVIYREGGYEFEFIAKYGDVVIAVTSDDNAGQAECLVIQGVEWYLTDNEGEDTATVTELYYSGTTLAPTGTDTGDDDTSSTPAPATPTPSNPADGGESGGSDSGNGDSDQPASKPEQVELGGSLNNDHQVVVGGGDQPSGDTGTGNGGSDNGSTGSGNNSAIVIPDEDVTGTIKGEDNISNNPNLSHEETSLGDRVVSKPAMPNTPAPADTPAAPADNSENNNVSTDAGKADNGGASKPAPAPTPQPQPENPPVVVESTPAPADNTPAPADEPTVICDDNGDCKIVW